MEIIVLFKTHLDIGFTDFSENVVRKYNEIYIPKAISVAREVAQSGRAEGFVWTVGSWLVTQYLETADEEAKAQLMDAIEKGWVSWHGLPFTMHSEVCTAELYEYGLSLSRKLDAQFHTKTTGAKYTDVPGHTAAIIPYLVKNGMTFLHIGVNPASTAVQVPSVFRWKYGEYAINVMYNGGAYGEFTRIPGTDTYVYFAHTDDNRGPQSAEVVYQVYDEIYSRFPGATVRAGTLNDVAAAVEKVSSMLEVVDGEMGDTWIHGAGTDPQKMSQYKALLRYCESLVQEERERIFKHLLMIPEHTWGMDEKLFLKENENYIRPLFEKARGKENFRMMEQSWAEQRGYLLRAAEAAPYQRAAEAAMNEYHVAWPDFSALTPVDGQAVSLNGLDLTFSPCGAITALHYEGTGIHLSSCELFGFSYDEYSHDEVWQFQEQYLKTPFMEDFRKTGELNWAIHDFGKYGLQFERNVHTASAPLDFALYTDKRSIYVQYRMDEAVTAQHGLPQRCMLVITPQKDSILFDFSWFGKPANRAPEALWLSFQPGRRLQAMSKLGYAVDPSSVLEKGGRGLHATDGKVFFDGLTVELIDSALVSVGRKNVFYFETCLPDMDKGVYFNLFNNQWGTNFPMWNEGDGRARFVLSAER